MSNGAAMMLTLACSVSPWSSAGAQRIVSTCRAVTPPRLSITRHWARIIPRCSGIMRTDQGVGALSRAR